MQMVMSMKVSGEQTKHTVKVFSLTTMEQPTKAIGLKISNTDKARKPGIKDLRGMKALSSKVRKTAMADMNGKMALTMKAAL